MDRNGPNLKRYWEVLETSYLGRGAIKGRDTLAPKDNTLFAARVHRFKIRDGLCNVIDIIDDQKCCCHEALIELLKLLRRNRVQNPMGDHHQRIIALFHRADRITQPR